MLVLGRRAGEEIKIGDNITITIVRNGRHGVRVGVDSPKDVPILRGELYEQEQAEQRQAFLKSMETFHG